MCWICVSQVDQQDLETANKSQELKGHSGLMINSLEKNKQEKRHWQMFYTVKKRQRFKSNSR